MSKYWIATIGLFAATMAGCTPLEPLERTPAPLPQPEPSAAKAAAEAKEAESVMHATTLQQLQSQTMTGSNSVRYLSSGLVEVGSIDAPATLTLFTEYHCSYCQEFHQDYLPRLREDFIDQGLSLIHI